MRGKTVNPDNLGGIRPEFRRLLKDNHYRLRNIAEMSGTTGSAISMAISRGGMSELMAMKIERGTGGKYRARLLVRKGR